MNAPVQTTPVDLNLDVRQRLDDLRTWREIYEQEERALQARVDALNEDNPNDFQVAAQIKSRRLRLLMQLVKWPIEIRADIIQDVGYLRLREHLDRQFRSLSREERLLWLQNFMFLMVPEVQELAEKSRMCSTISPQGNHAASFWVDPLDQVRRRFSIGMHQITCQP
jgi:hypothetical protein